MFPRISNFISKISHHIPSMLFSSAQASEAKQTSYSKTENKNNSLTKLEKNIWNTDITGQVGKWDIVQATNFQTDAEKHPFKQAGLRIVNNTTGLLARGMNRLVNDAGSVIDLNVAIEDFTVKHGGPSYQEVAVSLQVATPGIPDEAVPYGISKLNSYAREARGFFGEVKAVEQFSVRELSSLEKLSLSAQEMDRNGLTKAGRALQKHSSRRDSAFIKPNGFTYKNYNQKGKEIVEQILKDPKTAMNIIEKGSSQVIDFIATDGKGIRFSENGKFIGFREPQ